MPRRNLDPWIRIVAGTLTLMVVAQAAINMGYLVGLLPVTGVTLPLTPDCLGPSAPPFVSGWIPPKMRRT